MKDTYIYIALRNDGTIFEIGDETGQVKQVGKMPQITFNIAYNTVTSDSDKTYLYEQVPEIISGDDTQSGFKGQLCELDIRTLDSKCTIMDFSNDVFPEFAGLIALDWDPQNRILVGLVTDVVNTSRDNPVFFVHIDPGTFEVSYTGIQFVQGYTNSTCLVGNTYFISGKNDAFNTKPLFNALDLSNGTLKTISTAGIDSPPFLLSYNAEAKKLFGLAWNSNTGFFNSSIPVVYDVDKQQIEKLSPSRMTTFKQEFGKSYFNASSHEQVALIDGEMGGLIMRYDMVTDTFKFVPLIPLDDGLSSLVAIVNVK